MIKIPDSLVTNERPEKIPARIIKNKFIFLDDLYFCENNISEKLSKLNGIKMFSNRENRDIKINSGTTE